MQIAFYIIALITLAGALGAVSLRNLVHCALCLVVTFGGIATLFLQLDAQFIGFAQILVYIGAVAILIVFAILLTRGGDTAAEGSRLGPSWWAGLLVAALVFASLGAAVLGSSKARRARPETPTVTVKDIGVEMMQGKAQRVGGNYVLPLEVAGLLLTAAMIGAVVIALPERRAAQAGRRSP